jgi:hypothetical protein
MARQPEDPRTRCGKRSIALRQRIGDVVRADRNRWYVDAVYVDRASGREVQRIRQRSGIAWFVLTPDPACAQPRVTLAVTGGVRRTP